MYARNMRTRTSLALAALLALACPRPSAHAEEGASQPNPLHAYLAEVQSGVEKIRDGALDEALEIFRRAKEADPSRPQAAYYEGVVLKLQGDLEAAVTAFRSARVLATHAGDLRFEARALQAAAMVLELSPEKRAEAKAAWEELAAFLREHPETGVASVPGSRLEKMTQVAEAEAHAAAVVRKLEERQEELRRLEAERAAKKSKNKKTR